MQNYKLQLQQKILQMSVFTVTEEYKASGNETNTMV